jgi:DNA-binding transcriptional MocR family regulator
MSDTEGATLTTKIISAIRMQIDTRTLTPGAKLPSVRKMAATKGVATSTVVEAYERLAGEGLIRSRPGSGFYVAGPLAPLALDRIGRQVEREVDPLWMLRQSLGERKYSLTPGCGWLPDDWLAGDAIRKAMRRVVRSENNAALAGYSSPLGLLSLRTLLARRLAEQGLEAGPDRILLTDSGTQALDLICRFFLQADDTVLVDDPCYFNFLALLRAHRAKVVGVPMTPTGPDLAVFEEQVTIYRPRLYLTNSGIHNPTGASLSAASAHRLLKLAEAHDVIVVEDDIFVDFEHVPSPRLAAYDGLDRVIRIGSFSKSLSASMRCGHIAGRADWIEALADLRIATSLSGSPLTTGLLYTLLTDGSYRRYLEGVRARLSKATARVIKRLRNAGLEPWIEPAAGIFVWARLPHGVEAVDLARRALEEDIVLAPGPVFSPSGGWRDHMRFNVAMSDDDRLSAFLTRAAV